MTRLINQSVACKTGSYLKERETKTGKPQLKKAVADHSSPVYILHITQVSRKSNGNFVSYPASKQTDTETDS